MPELLSDEDKGKALGRLQNWRLRDGALVRTVELATFPQAIEVVDRVAVLAEEADHHPDIDIRWRSLTFSCSTHSEGGLTALDVELAAKIDDVLDSL
jgi:4a-hydroxytetrahydrobiopterin dehydratase